MASGEDKNQRNLRKTYFDVLGICCPSEVPLIEDILKSLDGVKEFSVIVPSRTVIVVHDNLIVSQLQIVRALNQARLEANVRVSGDTTFKKKWPSPFVIVSGVLLVFSFLKYVYTPFRWLAVAAVAAGVFPIASKSIASIIRFRIDINILSILAVIGTMAMKDYTEAATIVFLFSIAEWLETRASHKASAVMLSLMSLAPQKAVIAETGEEVEVNEVELNTVLAVKAGETVPVDGIVVDGNCEVDEKTLTGEPFPVSKQIGSIIWAGTINLDGYIKVKTTALAADSVVAKMAKLVEDAQNSKTKTQRFIDKCSQYYTPAVVVVAACFAVIPAVLKFPNLENWFHLALVVLVSACPCGLILSTPVATFCALAKAATSGLLIKGGDYLETLARIKIAAFDKTGTITRGEFFVLDFKSLSPDISLDNLLFWVSSIESKSSHPMASALVDYAKLFSVDPNPDSVEDYQNFPGEGIYGRIDGRDVFVGNKRIALRAGCQTVPDLEVDMNGGKTVGYVYVGERLVGMFNVSDACRSGVSQAIKELKSLGLKVAMLTGDNQAAAMHAQEQLGNGLDSVHAELLPEDKSKIIEAFKQEGATAMVGDGINDAPALATADIGISMGVSGSALATETGNIILMSNDIRKIPTAIKLARKAHRKVIENIFLSITIKGGILATAFAGYPLVSVAVLGDVGTCLLVILNSMLLLREKYTPADKCYRNSASAPTAPKFANADTEDLEAGLLQSTCNSSCCQAAENIVSVKPARLEATKSECCGERLNVQGKAQCRFVEPAGLGKCQNLKDNRDPQPGCCENKNQEAEENIMRKRLSDLERGLQMKGAGNCKSGCCGKKEQAVEKVSIDGSITQPSGMREKKNDGSCKSGCCKKKEQAKEEVVVEPADSGRGIGTNKAKSCKSGCCKEKQTEPTDLKRGPQAEVNRSCNTGCCSKKQQAKKDVLERSGCAESLRKGNKDDAKQITCSERVADSNARQGMETNNVKNCKSSCCKQKQEEPADLERCMQAEVNRSCNIGCCSKNRQAKEEVPEESGSQKAKKDVTRQITCSEKVADLNARNNGDCKSDCCRDNVAETIGLQIENSSGNCEGSCCDEKQGCEMKNDKCRGLEECGSECMGPKRIYHDDGRFCEEKEGCEIKNNKCWGWKECGNESMGSKRNCHGEVSCCEKEGCEMKKSKCRALEECGSESMGPKRNCHGELRCCDEEEGCETKDEKCKGREECGNESMGSKRNCHGEERCCDEEEGCEIKNSKCRGHKECGSESMGLKRNYNRGCCRHFHKECCRRSQRLGAAGGFGGLTQIVIE